MPKLYVFGIIGKLFKNERALCRFHIDIVRIFWDMKWWRWTLNKFTEKITRFLQPISLILPEVSNVMEKPFEVFNDAMEAV